MSLLDYLRPRYPEEIAGELVFPPVGKKCAACRGLLLDSEVRFGTCGHCGGRSISRRDSSASQLTRPGELLSDNNQPRGEK